MVPATEASDRIAEALETLEVLKQKQTLVATSSVCVYVCVCVCVCKDENSAIKPFIAKERRCRYLHKKKIVLVGEKQNCHFCTMRSRSCFVVVVFFSTHGSALRFTSCCVTILPHDLGT